MRAKPVGHRPGNAAHRPELAALQQGAQPPVAPVGALVEHGPKDQPGPGGGGREQAQGVGLVHGHRLFHEHVQARGQGGQPQGHVGEVRGGDQDRVHPPAGKERARLAKALPGRKAPQPPGLLVTHRSQLCARDTACRNLRGMDQPHIAEADHAETYFLHIG